MKNDENKPVKRKVTSKQIVALIGVILLVLLYVITLVAALADRSSSASWFRICLAATIALPLIIWIYTWLYGRMTQRPAIGDPDLPKQNEVDKKKSHTSQNNEHN